MISFKQFITEKQSIDIEYFKKECKSVLRLLHGTKGEHLMYRGMYDAPKNYAIMKWKQRTEPRDTTKVAHDAMNDYFEHKFGRPLRNWMFATGYKIDAQVYSPSSKPAAIIFPIGQFEWANADDKDARDLTNFFSSHMYKVRDNHITQHFDYEEQIDLALEKMCKEMDEWTWNFNENFVKALTNKNEIMFKCEKFYAFDPNGEAWNSPEMQELINNL